MTKAELIELLMRVKFEVSGTDTLSLELELDINEAIMPTLMATDRQDMRSGVRQ